MDWNSGNTKSMRAFVRPLLLWKSLSQCLIRVWTEQYHLKLHVSVLQTFQTEISGRQPEVDRLTKTGKKRTPSESGIPLAIPSRRTTGRSPRKFMPQGTKTPEPEFKNPRIAKLFNKWRHVWLMSMDRQRQLQDALDRLNEASRYI